MSVQQVCFDVHVETVGAEVAVAVRLGPVGLYYATFDPADGLSEEEMVAETVAGFGALLAHVARPSREYRL